MKKNEERLYILSISIPKSKGVHVRAKTKKEALDRFFELREMLPKSWFEIEATRCGY